MTAKEKYVRDMCLLQTIFKQIDNGESPSFEALRGVMGVCVDPMSYESAKALIEEGSIEALGRLGRSPQGLKKYWEYRENVISKSYASVTDYLMHSVFNMPTVKTSDGKLKVERSLDGLHEVFWRKNDFPYYFEQDVEHHVLWSCRPLSPAELLHEIDARRQGYEYCWFVNPPLLMSVPTLWHAHVISKKKT